MLDNPLIDRAVLAGHREWFGVRQGLGLLQLLGRFFRRCHVFSPSLRIAPMGGHVSIIGKFGASVQSREAVNHLRWNVRRAMAGFPRRAGLKGNDAEQINFS
jgi:hypothetical protein